MELNSEDRGLLRRVDTMLDAFKAHGIRKRSTATSSLGDMHMTLGQCQAFLAVAMNEGETMVELARRTGMSHSTISRYLIILGTIVHQGSEGLGIVHAETDPNSLRCKRYTLTDKGRTLAQSLIKSVRP
jgi:DNA-binding MarR family transcriptional regulator